MTSNNDAIQRYKPMHREFDNLRPRMPINDGHLPNLHPSPHSVSSSSTIHTIRPSPIPGNFTNLSSASSTLSSGSGSSASASISTLTDAMSTFNKERLHDVLQHGLGTYIFVDHFGLVPKLNHF
jgi:hypothetical protein